MKACIFLILLALVSSDYIVDYCISNYYAPYLNRGLIMKGSYVFGKCGGCISQFVGYGNASGCKCVPVEYVKQCNADSLCKIDELSGICWKK